MTCANVHDTKPNISDLVAVSASPRNIILSNWSEIFWSRASNQSHGGGRGALSIPSIGRRRNLRNKNLAFSSIRKVSWPKNDSLFSFANTSPAHPSSNENVHSVQPLGGPFWLLEGMLPSSGLLWGALLGSGPGLEMASCPAGQLKASWEARFPLGSPRTRRVFPEESSV